MAVPGVHRARLVALGLSLLLCGTQTAVAGDKPFEEAEIAFEQNATDEDVEVVFHIKGGDADLESLEVRDPAGNIVFSVSSPNPMGMRSFVLESPEPRDAAALRRAFPEGEYSVTGTSVKGQSFASRVPVSHALPEVAGFQYPAEEAEDIPVHNLTITWSGVEGIEAYLIEIEQEETGVTLNVTLPADARSFLVPNGFLSPDTEYVLAIGTMAEGGNASFVETGFTTAEE